MPQKTIKLIFYTAILLVVTFLCFFGALGIISWLFPSASTLDMIDNETLLALLGLLVIFGGLLAYIFQRIIRIELKEEIKKKLEEDWRKERNLSRVELKLSLGFFHMRLYKIVYGGRTNSQDQDGKAKNEIDLALVCVKEALKHLEEMKKEEYLDYLFKTKNNLAYYLARKWNYYREEKSDQTFKEYLKNSKRTKEYKGDKRIANGCIDYLITKKAPELRPDLSQNFEDTFAWVEKIFSVDVDIQLGNQ